MSRKWIVGAAALSAAGVMAFAAASVLGTETQSSARPAYATVSVDLGKGSAAARPVGGGTKKKPKLTYLQTTTPSTINPADLAAGGVGPYIDVKLTGCAKVIDGGVVPSRLDVYVQGSYVKSASEYHVLIGLDANNLGNRAPFTITSNLTCLKGVK